MKMYVIERDYTCTKTFEPKNDLQKTLTNVH